MTNEILEPRFTVAAAASAIGITPGNLRNWMNKHLKRRLKTDTPQGSWRKFSIREVLELALTAELSIDSEVLLEEAYEFAKEAAEEIWGAEEHIPPDATIESLFTKVPTEADAQNVGDERDISQYRIVLNKWEFGPEDEPGPYFKVEVLHKDQLPEHKPYRFFSLKPRRITFRALVALGLVDEDAQI